VSAQAAPIHVRPTAPLAERVLLPGDPGRALALAQALLSEPRMFNHNRGLWGYTGEATDGLPLTIQSTGMGGPSAAIVLTELAELEHKHVTAPRKSFFEKVRDYFVPSDTAQTEE